MPEFVQLIEANWPILGAVLLLAVLIAWWIWSRSRPVERRRAETQDVLTPGAAPAQRNTLLVEAPPLVATAPIAGAVPDILGGMSEVIAAATADEIANAEAADEVGEGDDLTRIKGLGPKLNARLGQLGIRRYDQIAAWSDDDVARIDAQLGAFQGRIVRDNWIDQCRYLAAGDIAGYEAKYGKV